MTDAAEKLIEFDAWARENAPPELLGRWAAGFAAILSGEGFERGWGLNGHRGHESLIRGALRRRRDDHLRVAFRYVEGSHKCERYERVIAEVQAARWRYRHLDPMPENPPGELTSRLKRAVYMVVFYERQCGVIPESQRRLKPIVEPDTK